MKINFTKMHGCGNDFIIIDNRNNILRDFNLKKFVKTVCTRKLHIGANGLMIIENSTQANFSMRYFNSDGSEGEMCGNGARCIAKFAYVNGIADKDMHFETLDGIYKASILKEENVRVNFPAFFIKDITFKQRLTIDESEECYHFASVGVPHTIIFKNTIADIDEETFVNCARKIRYNDELFPKGTNVNIVEVKNKKELLIRTYERGVEEETLACGSGATASAIISALLDKTYSKVRVQTKGGLLTIGFQMNHEIIDDITLIGNAEIVFTGSFYYSEKERRNLDAK